MIQSRSTYGRRAAICEKMGWTLNYINHSVSYAVLIRCLIDMPRYEYDEDNKNGSKIKLTAENAADFVNLINSQK